MVVQKRRYEAQLVELQPGGILGWIGNKMLTNLVYNIFSLAQMVKKLQEF